MVLDFTEVLLDVRGLEAPEPLTKVLAVLPKLQTNCYIKMLHRQQPFPLYDVLLENNFDYCICEIPLAKGYSQYAIFIWLSVDGETAKHCQQLASDTI